MVCLQPDTLAPAAFYRVNSPFMSPPSPGFRNTSGKGRRYQAEPDCVDAFCAKTHVESQKSLKICRSNRQGSRTVYRSMNRYNVIIFSLSLVMPAGMMIRRLHNKICGRDRFSFRRGPSSRSENPRSSRKRLRHRMRQMYRLRNSLIKSKKKQFERRNYSGRGL